MANLFRKIELQAFKAGITPRTKESRAWFQQKIKSLRSARINRNELLKNEDIRVTDQPEPGKMYMYFYDAKTKDILPVWDRFPLVVMVDTAPGGFYGLNLHYLPPMLRAKMLDALMDTLNNKAYNETTRFKINYKIVKRLGSARYYRGCFKHYLIGNVQSHFAEVQPTEWEIATFLPSAQWQKGSANDAYRYANKAING